MTEKLPKTVTDYLAQIGAKGGSVKGAVKRRGPASHYSAIARKRWKLDRERREKEGK